MRVVFAVGLLGLLLIGCRTADRTILLTDGKVEVLPPIFLTNGRIPITASRDGKYVAVLEGETKLSVLQLDSLEPVAETPIPKDTKSTPIFSLDGKELLLDQSEGRVAWNFETGAKRKLDGPLPVVAIVDGFGGEWNVDRTIGYTLSTDSKPGQVMFATGLTKTIPPKAQVGFDPRGRIWINGTGFDRDGSVATFRGDPPQPYLVPDQSRVRGSMHLEAVETISEYRGASAPITCIWLVHDRAKVTQGKQRPALIYAGADVFEWAFVPGRNMVYVFTSVGSYFVPFKIEQQ